MGMAGISRGLPSPRQSEPLYKTGTAFSAPAIPGNMEPFSEGEHQWYSENLILQKQQQQQQSPDW